MPARNPAMPPSDGCRSAGVDRYTTLCQQLLALALVLVVLTPAAGVINMDIGHAPGVGTAAPDAAPGGPIEPGGLLSLAAYTKETTKPSPVPTQPVDPIVDEYSLTAPTSGGFAAGGLQGRFSAGRRGAAVVTSAAMPVTGYGTVGVTWQHGVAVAERAISFQVRTERDGAWSGWATLQYHDQHGPDPDSDEGRRARPGTDEALVGHVDRVQVRSTAKGGTLPADMKLAVISPGVAAATKEETPAIDTGRLSGDPAAAPDAMAPAAPAAPAAPEAPEAPAAAGMDSGRLALSAAAYTPKPKIYSRAQWGADERMRDKSSLHYFEVHAGFVHHTVNANDYTRAEVPGLLRSIYAYHTRSKGWSDIGYNYLVDRFGRIWEGRYGGVDRPVVGAHTLGYNDYSFAMSAIGNYDIAQPSEAMIEAYGALFAWKLALHGIPAAATSERVGDSTFEAINGHRDAGSTACPGKYLYARIPTIRKLAAAAQRGWYQRGPQSDIASNPFPDLLVRRASDGQGLIVPTGGLIAFAKAGDGVPVPAGVSSVVGSPDLTGDRRADLLVTDDAGEVSISPGARSGFGARIKRTTIFEGHDLLTPVGDLNGDGHNDVVARDTETDRLDVYVGGGSGGFVRRSTASRVWADYDLLAATGDLTGDGRADLLGRTASGAMYLHAGTGTGGFRTRARITGRWGGFDAVTGFGDYTGDQKPDLVVRLKANGNSFVMPSNGDGTFGRLLGPYSRLRGLTGLSGAGQLVGNRAPDLIARRGDRLVVVGNRGTVNLRPPIETGVDLSSADKIMDAGDWDRDGHGDMITRNRASGTLWLRRGDGTGHFGDGNLVGRGFGRVSLLEVVGDVTGDGYPDLMGQPSGGDLTIYPGRGTAGLGASYAAHSAIDASRQVALGLWDRDGAPDSAFRSGDTLTLYPGNGPGGLTTGRGMGVDIGAYDWLIGISDIRAGGHSDLLARDKRTGSLYLLQGTARGFAAPRLLGQGMGGYDLVG